MDRFTLDPFEFFVLRTRTRFPFRYGIASLTEVPQLFVRARVVSGRDSHTGLAAEGLPPKWFTKDPDTTFEADLQDMFEVIAHAAAAASDAGRQPVTFFELWRALNGAQEAWARDRGRAPLLAHLGVSLVERAVLDALCRLAGEPLHRMVLADRLGLRLGEIYPELGSSAPRDGLPEQPLESCFIRHTIGLADALGPDDLAPDERVDDGLPQDLEASVRAYGLRYFKVKLSGVPARDFPRLRDLVRLLERETGGRFHVTVDGNENFRDFEAFRAYWDEAQAQPELRGLWPRVIAVEQPVHRDAALGREAGSQLKAWAGRPPLIVDESDGAVGDVPRALDLGYAGASHKNCKGIVKGIANAALLGKRRREGAPALLTGEDLCILGPVALLQDLAMMAMLGIGHVERNGHHYYRGLSMLPAGWQEATLAAHPDLYTRHAAGFARLRIEDGQVRLGSANRAPFGVQPELDPSVFAPLDVFASGA
jgi:L-alanine-DL-glutamate epimerase-like enolase superfamily enzyme